MVEDLIQKILKSKSIFFLNYEGLKVADIQKIKKELKKEMIDYVVSKKTLLKLASEKANLKVNPKSIPGNFALIFSYADEVAPAKILTKFAKEFEKMSLIGGILGGELISAAKVADLAKLPSKMELLAKLVGSLNAPLSGFVTVLGGNLRGLIRVLSQIKK